MSQTRYENRKTKQLMGKPNEKVRYAHGLVASTASAIARDMYERIMSKSNHLYAYWKAACPELTPQELEERFVAQMTPKLLEQARATLAKMLALPGNDDLKQPILEALIADNQVRILRGPQGAGHRIG